MSALELPPGLDERLGIKLLGDLGRAECVCRCVLPEPPPAPHAPELLGALGVLVLAAGVFGYGVGRVRRLRSRVVRLIP